ncbi:MAG: uroporphyrinogen-III synthase [Tolumonas sp.]
MTPLILRPQPAADELAARLRRDGHTPVVCPLLTYQSGCELALLPAMLTQADITIAVSAAAVQYASHYLQQQHLPWPATMTYLAVGPATAAACRQQHLAVSSPADARSEGLLALPGLLMVHGKRIVILRGNGGRELLTDTLRRRGAEVTCVECYRRHYLQTDGRRLLQEWQAAAVDSVIITSSELFQQLLTLLPDTATSWLSGLHWFVVSERTAEELRSSGFNRITIMPGAQHEAVAAALSE